jgi:hypothetical protein
MKYDYPQVAGGYRWNMLQRIKNAVGIEPTSSGDHSVDGVWYTRLEFSRNLMQAEKALLDTVMASNPTYPPIGTAKFKIADLWEKLAQFNASAGTNFQLYYNESVPGSGVIDQLELHSSGSLTITQKNKAKTSFAGLIAEA